MIHRLVPVGTPHEQREKTLRSWARTYGYKLSRGVRPPDLDAPTGDPQKYFLTQFELIRQGHSEPGYMLFDNRTGLNVLGGAAGRDGLGATSELEAWSATLDDVEEFLGEIRAQLLRRQRGD
jgi:hypothetical protein